MEKIAPTEPPVIIKMDRLSIPIFADESVAATILIELKVEAIGLENQTKITKLLPRLSDAFFKDLYVFIPRLIRRKIKLTADILAERIQKVADKILGAGVFHKVVIIKVTDS